MGEAQTGCVSRSIVKTATLRSLAIFNNGPTETFSAFDYQFGSIVLRRHGLSELDALSPCHQSVELSSRLLSDEIQIGRCATTA